MKADGYMKNDRQAKLNEMESSDAIIEFLRRWKAAMNWATVRLAWQR